MCGGTRIAKCQEKQRSGSQAGKERYGDTEGVAWYYVHECVVYGVQTLGNGARGQHGFIDTRMDDFECWCQYRFSYWGARCVIEG